MIKTNVIPMLVCFAGMSFYASSSLAQITLAPGQSQTIVCSQNGGGSNTTLACVQSLNDWCYSNTSLGRDECYQTASSYCPSRAFSDCVAETADYCYDNTSMDRDRCYSTALGTCRGNVRDTRLLLEQVQIATKLTLQGVDLSTLKTPHKPKSSTQ